jgi:transcriptional regulator NrdR family protein
MKCPRCSHNVYRVSRRWWERLIGVRRAAHCDVCRRRVRSFHDHDRQPIVRTPTAVG